jgi:hypothetical protein
MFFFAKKNQKTFAPAQAALWKCLGLLAASGKSEN